MKTKLMLIAALLFAAPFARADAGGIKIEIAVTASGSFEVQKKAVSLADIQNLLAKEKDATVRVYADPKARAEAVVSVMEACRHAGVTKIYLGSEKKA